MVSSFEVPIWHLKRPREGPDMDETQALLPAERIEHAIVVLRGERVMLDEDIAALYVVETKTLIRSMK
jgi:ORF6N domain